MTRLEGERDTVSVVDDQVGSPTWSADLAQGLVELGARQEPPPAVLHYVNAGQVSWYGLARAVFTELGADPERVLPTTTAAFPRPAPRPAYSVLDTTAWSAAGLTPPRPWHEALHEAMSKTRREGRNRSSEARVTAGARTPACRNRVRLNNGPRCDDDERRTRLPCGRVLVAHSEPVQCAVQPGVSRPSSS